MSLLPEIEYVALELGTRMVPHVAPISAVVRSFAVHNSCFFLAHAFSKIIMRHFDFCVKNGFPVCPEFSNLQDLT